MKLSGKIHRYEHRAVDGTILHIEFDLSGDVAVVRSNTDMTKHMELAQEFEAWANLVSQEVMELLTHDQLIAAARYGFQKLHGL